MDRIWLTSQWPKMKQAKRTEVDGRTDGGGWTDRQTLKLKQLARPLGSNTSLTYENDPQLYRLLEAGC